MAGLVLLGLLAWPATLHLLTPLELAILANTVLLIVALWESMAVRRATGWRDLFGPRQS
jgi:hypothetical protein